jgi:DNA-binding cell septation regulator SpoVG
MSERVFNLELVGKGALKASVSVDLGGGLITHHWKILERDGLLSVCVPQVRRGPQHLDVLHFEDSERLQRINQAVLDHYIQDQKTNGAEPI